MQTFIVMLAHKLHLNLWALHLMRWNIGAASSTLYTHHMILKFFSLLLYKGVTVYIDWNLVTTIQFIEFCFLVLFFYLKVWMAMGIYFVLQRTRRYMLMSARDFRTNLSSNMCCFFSPEENNLFPYPWSFCTTEKLEKEKDLW